jgi:hypothetical protein
MVTRGIALADVDGDGRLDFAVANQWEPSFLFHNTAPNPGAFLGLHGKQKNHPSCAQDGWSEFTAIAARNHIRSSGRRL